MTYISRRNMLMGSTAMLGPVLAGCSGQQIDIIGTITQLIQKVQEGVAAACQQFGKMVPTVDFIMATIATLLGTALIPANLVAAVAILQKIIETIAGQCSPAPTDALDSRKKFY